MLASWVRAATASNFLLEGSRVFGNSSAKDWSSGWMRQRAPQAKWWLCAVSLQTSVKDAQPRVSVSRREKSTVEQSRSPAAPEKDAPCFFGIKRALVEIKADKCIVIWPEWRGLWPNLRIYESNTKKRTEYVCSKICEPSKSPASLCKIFEICVLKNTYCDVFGVVLCKKNLRFVVRSRFLSEENSGN